ncbi:MULTISPECIES: ABC transporter permease/substrate-binding protein [unclassified Granulicatella]|uniref:ABC transporter permease/substrate-binding protein n=1 Tax=unclassified Granulicatella TaxID=2630493 RepID=UPI00107340D9|nr:MULTISPECIES: ABC transporter permease/substrate-binding protein [unclassified Granulicatella]MBF0780322.1 ABC transporter permease/substrate-binding protein [Granulicatella sp. 19428wC4_WM01]TFU95549.1 ABC transporter permease/substrate-binding protein [Granulicatella sp. WM01]
MSDLIQTFMERKEDWLKALLEHVHISFLALVISIILAFPLAIFIAKKRKLSEIILQITGIMQTIPSLAILGLLIPFLGIGKFSAIVTLIVYALFPILQNTVTGFNEIDPSLQEAATAFGMSKWEKLKKFEFALALPVIMSGIRTASVLIIGTATLAALIGAGGLGSFILLGIDRNNGALIFIGATSSALLAVLFNMIIGFIERFNMKTLLISFTGIALLGIMSVLPMSMMQPNTLVIAGKLGAEPEILINMYKELIEAETAIKVELKVNFGKTSFLYEALKNGKIDVYPEFSGTITSSLLATHPKVSNNPREVYETAKNGIYEQDKLVFLSPMAYQNTYAIAIPLDYAKENGIDSISDLSRVEQSAIAGFSLEFNDREDGNLGLKKVYGLTLNVRTIEPSLRYKGIQSGEIQIVDAYSTDSQIREYNLKVLEDDKHLFPPYQVAPLMREDVLKKYPEIKPILEKLANKITVDEMIDMNYQVNVLNKKSSDVARGYLQKNGLLK